MGFLNLHCVGFLNVLSFPPADQKDTVELTDVSQFPMISSFYVCACDGLASDAVRSMFIPSYTKNHGVKAK